jgi:hypothetical protein
MGSKLNGIADIDRESARRRRIVAAARATNAILVCLAASTFASCLPAAPPRSLQAPSVPSTALLSDSLEQDGLDPDVFALARDAYDCGKARGYFDKPILTVIDYSLPSTQRRLWVLDLESEDVLFHELVAHGRGSGENFAVLFSNLEGSKQSSLGLFRTGETYDGKHGYSLRLSGLEPGVNDLAEERAIVIHGADYATPAFAERHGRLGRSWGCPALDPSVHRRVIDTIKDGTALFVYYPDDEWLGESSFLDGQCGTR